MWVKSHFRKLYGKQLTFSCHHDFWKWKCTRNLDKVTQERKISHLTCLVLVSWSSFLVWNHWAMFMNYEWIIMTSSNGIFPRYWSFLRVIHRSPVNSPHKGQWRGTLIFCLICVRINGWEKNHEARDLGRHRAHYDVIVIRIDQPKWTRNEVHIWYGRPIFNHCDPLTSYGDILLCEHWFR